MTDPIVHTANAPTSDEWETPKRLFEIASRAWGPIDLDAAATNCNTLAPSWIGPDHVRSDRRDALSLDDWFLNDDRVAWLNPPYSKTGGPLLSWMKKAAEQGCDGREVIVLAKSDTSTEWFRFAFKHAHEIVFLQPRIQHLKDGVKQKTPPWGSMLIRFTGSRPANVRIARWK